MAKSVNKVILIGRLGKDPELKYTASGTPFCRFSMATDDVWNDKTSGERQEKTEWHNVVVWDRLAEICGQYLGKGQQVAIEGRLQTRSWDDDRGARHWKTEVVATNVEMLSGRRKKDYEAETAADALAAQANALGEAPGITVAADTALAAARRALCLISLGLIAAGVKREP